MPPIVPTGTERPLRAPTLVPEPGTPLYLHLPFCVAKCTYCDFYSLAAEGHDLPRLVEAILREAEARAPRAPRTVFLGGGTPSLLALPELTRLLEGLEELTGFRDSASEVTLECNPESLDLEKARALRSLGVDRLSLGFQTLDPALLELFGRVHSAAESFAVFAAAREAGFERLSVDLIYAAPGQTLASWERDLETVLELAPEHLSAYHLAFEEGTPFLRWLDEGRLERHDEETELAFLRQTRAQLEARAYRGYEVSNFALSGHECEHNLNYWRNGAYLGLGPSAVSKLGHTRFGNPRSLGAWRTAVEAGRPAVAWEETLPAAERLAETWWLGLRLTAGLDPIEARRRAGWPDPETDPTRALREELALEGLLEEHGASWRLTAAGRPLADAVAARFLALPRVAPEAHEPAAARGG